MVSKEAAHASIDAWFTQQVGLLCTVLSKEILNDDEGSRRAFRNGIQKAFMVRAAALTVVDEMLPRS